MSTGLSFVVEATEQCPGGEARVGRLELNGKRLDTPAFMPVGTLATVKSLSLHDLIDVGAQCILANTYHLHLRPGEGVVAELGGLHRFMGGWPGLILTDSGGYQVFSLAHLRKLEESAVTFQAHTDGSTHVFTPEGVVQIEQSLGSDIMMVLDECPPASMGFDEAQKSAERTTRWAARAKSAYTQGDGVLFGICQGGMFESLRHESAQALASLDFPGYGVGGLGIGEPKDVMRGMLPASISGLPPAKPRYLMGIGAPEDLVVGVMAGVDMFDCVLQTREARNGALLTVDGRLNINNARFTTDADPIDSTCDCSTCLTYSRAYLHHLFRNRELLGYRLATIHNVRWTLRLMSEIRAHIRHGRFNNFATDFLDRYKPRAASNQKAGGSGRQPATPRTGPRSRTPRL